MARIYVASSWRNKQYPEILKALLDEGHTVYDFRNPANGIEGFHWSEIDPEWKSWSPEEYRNNLLRHPIAARGFMSDKRAMEWADTCVLVLPCGRSAHLEAGWFCGAGKRCLILLSGNDFEPELMNLLATDICVNIEEVIIALREN